MPLRYLICLAAVASLALAVALSVGTRPTHAAELPSAISPSTGSQTTGSQTAEPQTAAPPTADPQTTPEHLRASAWWPTKPLPNLDAYAGTAACATCHADIVASQATSQMARTLTPASQSTVLNQHLRKLYHSGPYTYSLAKSPGKKGADISVSVSDGAQQQSAILQWALGSGDVGQSYLWQKDGAFYESRFNFFSTLDTFDSTPGRLHGTPISIDMAIGRPLEPSEARSCLSCHTTAMSSASPLDLKSIIPGVSCEVCHGPGRDHIAAAKSHLATPSAPWNKQIVNSARMSPTQSVNFCGACHSTPWDVRIMGAVGVQTVRFPAYRLEKSRCWGSAGDARLTCTACHDPHEPLARDPVAYDSACLDCHAAKKNLHAAGSPPVTPPDAAHPAPACPVATSKCATCHMPKYDLPEMRYKFTDHNIRIARRDAPFPD